MGRSISWYLLGKKITLCKYIGFKFPLTHTIFPIQYQFKMLAGWCSFSNDMAGIKYDFFLWLMGRETQGVSAGDAVHQRPEEPRSSQIETEAAAWPCVRVHVRIHIPPMCSPSFPLFLLLLLLLWVPSWVSVHVWFLWFPWYFRGLNVLTVLDIISCLRCSLV